MIIMQTASAIARRDHLTFSNQAKTILSHELEDSVCIQYHPKGIKGGVIPELDSHFPKDGEADGVRERFAPWHACGPSSGFEKYGAGMRRYGHLHLLSAALQLAPGDDDINGAAKQWEELFGVQRVENGAVVFTNAKMNFLPGKEGQSEGLKEINIGVQGEEILVGILMRVRHEGLKVDEGAKGAGGTFEMLGVRWRFVLLSESPVKSQL